MVFSPKVLDYTPFLNLKDPKLAYMFGFLQMDGSLYQGTRNRKKLKAKEIVKVSKIKYKTRRYKNTWKLN